MASASSIWRLHATEPERAPVKNANLAHLEIDVASEPDLLALQMTEWQRPARGFVSPRSSRLDPPVLMGAMAPTSLPMGRRDFADVAARENAAHLRAAMSRRIEQQSRRAGHQQHEPLAIQI
jgi:hypothetical protein